MGFYTASITTDGSGNGSNETAGVYNWTGNFRGFLMGMFVDDNGAAVTVDVTLTEPVGLKRTIFTGTDITADTTYNPHQEIQTNAGVGTGLYSPYLVDSSNLKVTVAQGGTSVTDAIKLTVLIMEIE